MEEYVSLIRQGKLNATDRNGRSMISGGDTQIVYTATHKGYSVGKAPELKLKHLISPRKANINYVRRMIFGVYNTGLVHLECDPSVLNTTKIPSRLGFYYMVIRQLLNHHMKFFSPFLQVDLVRYLGTLNSGFAILNRKIYWEIRVLKRLLKLEK